MKKTHIESTYKKPRIEKGEKTERVENLKLRPYSKAEIILIAAGEKPATEIDVLEDDTNYQEIADAAKALGLVVLKREQRAYDGQQANLIIARDKKTARELSEVSNPDDHDPRGEHDHNKYGQLMGFPESAIEAFAKKGAVLSTKENNALTAGMAMNEMALSRNSLPDELAHLQRWEETVKQLAPKVHHEIIEAKYSEQTIVSLDQIDIENAEDITLLLEVGTDEMLSTFASQTETDIEIIRLAAYYQCMKKNIRAEIQTAIRERLLNDPLLDEQEEKIGQVIECIEPQARSAAYTALMKGYPIVKMGFSSPEGHQYMRLSSPLFAEQKIPEEAKNELERIGVEIIFEDDREIDLMPQRKLSAAELRAAWNIVAGALPHIE